MMYKGIPMGKGLVMIYRADHYRERPGYDGSVASLRGESQVLVASLLGESEERAKFWSHPYGERAKFSSGYAMGLDPRLEKMKLKIEELLICDQ
nr:hypothetical protein [Tanacetum cinerariifolium]